MGRVIGAELAVVVVNYGSSALLALNLAPLSAALPGARIVVVDNRTTDAERAAVATLSASQGWTMLASDGNPGFGVGVNLAATRAFADGADHILILNPDATIAPAGVLALLEHSERAPGDLHCPRIETPDGRTWFAGAELHLADGRLRGTGKGVPGAAVEPWLSGAVLMASRELWQRVGGFDDDYFLYWEDVDLSHRVLAAGGSLALWPEIIAVHDEGGTHDDAGPGRAKSDTYYFHVIRNRLIFAAKHLDDAGYAAWHANRHRVAYETLLQGGRRQFLRSPHVMVVAIRALRDGVTLAREMRKGGVRNP